MSQKTLPKSKINPAVRIAPSSIPNAGMGVFATRDIKKGEVLDEYVGKFLTPEQYAKKRSHKNYIWELMTPSDEVIAYIDSGNKKYSNWTRFVNTPSKKSEANMINIQMNATSEESKDKNKATYNPTGTAVFYCAKKDIKKGEELLIWYGEEYAKYLKLI